MPVHFRAILLWRVKNYSRGLVIQRKEVGEGGGHREKERQGKKEIMILFLPKWLSIYIIFLESTIEILS